MKLSLIVFLLTAGILHQNVLAATPLGARQTITSGDLQRHVGFLASDTLEGRAAGTRGGRAAAAYLAAEFRRVGLTPAGEAGDFIQEFGLGYRNVLGLLRGRDPELSDQVIVVGGHFDHVGYGNPRNSFGPFGQIHNGADDNASGAAAILEVAEACTLLDEPPRRTILFALWDAEEDGMLGSEHWVTSPSVPLDRVRLVLNLDMIGRLRDDRLIVYGDRTADPLRQIVTAANQEPSLILDFDATLRQDSDHWTFYKRRIPYLMFHTGDHEDYHRPGDDAHKLNYAGLQRLTQLVFGVTCAAASTAEISGFREEVPDVEPHRSWEPSVAARPPRLGVSWNPRRTADEPLVIMRVVAESPAAQAGLQPGDRILQINGKAISEIDDFAGTVYSSPQRAQLLILREGQSSPQEVVVMLRSPSVTED